MARAPDEPIPPDEPLYRSISAADVIGTDVQSDAVDLPRCSFNRGKYSAPEAVIVERRPEDNGIVAITGNKLPGPVPRASGAPYEFFTADDPNPPEDPDNDAHCEVRVRPQDKPFSKNHKMNKEVRAVARDALARCLRIIKMPE